MRDHVGRLMSETAADRSSDFVQSLARGLTVLESFSSVRPVMSLSEVAKATGLTRATARRLVLTLEQLGYLRRTPQGFEPDARVMDLGYSYLASKNIWDVARPTVERLVAQTQESSSIAVLNGLEVVYVIRVRTNRIMSIGLNVGARLPAFSTSTGRVLLAALPDEDLQSRLVQWQPEQFTPKTLTSPAQLLTELERVRSEGFALVDQEIELGVNSIAVPLHGQGGEVVAALNVSAHASRVNARALKRTFLAPLRETAAEIDAAISGR